MKKAVDVTINQISLSCCEWSSFVCSLRFDLFHIASLCFINLVQTWSYLNVQLISSLHKPSLDMSTVGRSDGRSVGRSHGRTGLSRAPAGTPRSERHQVKTKCTSSLDKVYIKLRPCLNPVWTMLMLRSCLKHVWIMFGTYLVCGWTMLEPCLDHIGSMFELSLDHVETMFGPC